MALAHFPVGSGKTQKVLGKCSDLCLKNACLATS